MKKILVSGIVAAAVVVTGFASFAIANEKKELSDFKPFVSITAEQQEILKGKIKTDLDEMLAAGEITQEQYNSLVERVEKGAPCNMGGGKFGKGNFGKGPGNFEKPEMTEEQKAEFKTKAKEMLKTKLDQGKITQEEYDKQIEIIENGKFAPGFGRGAFGKKPGEFKIPEMTEEQKAEMKAKAKEMLKTRLDQGKITQEEYDEQLAKIESGEFNPGFGRGAFGKKTGEFKIPEITEEQKAEMKAKAKEMLKARLDEGKITQEEYDEQLAKIESGEFNPGFGRGPGRGNFGKGQANFRPGQDKNNTPKAYGKNKTKDAKKD